MTYTIKNVPDSLINQLDLWFKLKGMSLQGTGVRVPGEPNEPVLYVIGGNG